MLLLNAPLSESGAGSLTGEAGAHLTDAHNRVDKRLKIQPHKQGWGALVPAKLGDSLPEGTQLHTGDSSWAQISWPRVSTRIWENSIVAIEPNKRVVYLFDGQLLFNLDKDSSSGSKSNKEFEIWTKLIQARVRGTTFIVQSCKDFCRFSVLEGKLELTNKIDGSIIEIKPGVIYEVRVGAAPPATWIREESEGASPLQGPWQSPGQGPSLNSGPRAPELIKSKGSLPLKHTESEIQMKANELAKGDPKLREIYVAKLREMNVVESKKLALENEAKNKWSQRNNANNNPLHKGNSAFERMKSTGVRNYPRYSPLADTSQYAPLKNPAQRTTALSSLSKNKWVQDFSSHSVPPRSLSRDSKQASNLYIADLNQLLKHGLVQGFREQLSSMPLINSELAGLPEISHSQSYYTNDRRQLLKRDQVFAHAASIIKSSAQNKASSKAD